MDTDWARTRGQQAQIGPDYRWKTLVPFARQDDAIVHRGLIRESGQGACDPVRRGCCLRMLSEALD